MPEYAIAVIQRPTIEVRRFVEAQMRVIGAAAIEAMKQRNAAGRDVLDATNKPLGDAYAKRKIREGKQPIRDLELTGELLESVQITEARADYVKIAVPSSTYKKGIINQLIEPWFGLSLEDETRVIPEARRIFGSGVTHFSEIGQ